MSAPKKTIQSVPWSFLDPEAEWVAWQNRILAFENETRSTLLALEEHESQPGLRPSTRTRLQQLKRGKEIQRDLIRDLLRDFYPLDLGATPITLHLRSRISSQQGLLNYSTNILRDWSSWGKKENEQSVSLLHSIIKKNAYEKVLVMGAGAGRLAYDFHQNFEVKETIAFDHNPLLTLIAKRICEGGSVNWPEFPLNPLNSESIGAIELCKAPSAARDGLRFVLGDAMNLPFHPDEFDLILTPWVIDILPEGFEKFALRVNPILKLKGSWINFGSLAFQNPSLLERPSDSEILEILSDSGWSVDSSGRHELDYLHSPHHAQKRIESVFWFHAMKTSPCSAPETHQKIPAWLLDSTLPIPKTIQLTQIEQTSDVFGQVCKQINGKISIDELSGWLSITFGLPMSAATEAIKKFLWDSIEKRNL